jgi:flagellar basal-body rod modification protein FlgD
MTSPINSATTPAASVASSTSSITGPSQPLGQDAFLKLLMAQIQNQDPLNPVQGTEFVTQLSQFTMVEQSVNQTSQLKTIGSQLTGLSNSDATNLVGKTATVSGSGMTWDGVFATTSNVTLSGPAQDVKVSVSDSQGNVVRTMDLGAEPGGALAVTWDGKTDAGQPAPKGNYSISATATDASGQPVGVSQTATGVVTKVSFDQGYAQLTLSTGAVVPVSSLISVGSAPATNP